MPSARCPPPSIAPIAPGSPGNAPFAAHRPRGGATIPPGPRSAAISRLNAFRVAVPPDSPRPPGGLPAHRPPIAPIRARNAHSAAFLPSVGTRVPLGREAPPISRLNAFRPPGALPRRPARSPPPAPPGMPAPRPLCPYSLQECPSGRVSPPRVVLRYSLPREAPPFRVLARFARRASPSPIAPPPLVGNARRPPPLYPYSLQERPFSRVPPAGWHSGINRASKRPHSAF